MRITINDLQKRIQINPAKIKQIACKISYPHKSNNLKLNLYFVNNSVIRSLNKQFFGKDCLTDVVSFNLGEDYAEVFVAPCVVKSNAKVFRVKFQEELYRCVIHGVLHIFGFKDKFKKQRAKMWKRQECLLKKVYANGKN